MLSIIALMLLAPLASQIEADADHAKIARTMLEHIRDKKFEEVVQRFDETMRKVLPAEKVEEVWGGTVASYGQPERFGEARVEQAGTYEIVYITIHFQQGVLDAKIVFGDEHKIAGFFLVPTGEYQQPDYVDPEAFEESEVTVGSGLFTLPGTLTLPKGEGPFAAVVLVHGSGPQDRDETIGPNKPFRDLAHGLATKGIAVVRYEKRTHHHKLQMALLATSLTVKEETVDDAAAAVELAAKHEKIDAKRVFICGHSLGGYLIPRMATASQQCAGFVSLGGSARGLEVLIVEQNEYMARLDGEVTEEEEARIEQLQQLAKKISALKPGGLSLEMPGGAPASYWLDLKDYNPAEEAKNISRPLLFLQGGRDFQVTATDIGLWKAALRDHPNVTFREYPKLNHLFMAGEGKSSLAEYMTPSNVAEEVVNDIAAWIQDRKRS